MIMNYLVPDISGGAMFIIVGAILVCIDLDVLIAQLLSGRVAAVDPPERHLLYIARITSGRTRPQTLVIVAIPGETKNQLIRVKVQLEVRVHTAHCV